MSDSGKNSGWRGPSGLAPTPTRPLPPSAAVTESIARPAPLWLALALLLVATLVTGCRTQGVSGVMGYTSASMYPADVRTVAVPIFDNRTFETGLERQITDAVIKEIHARTPYQVVTEAEADTLLVGAVMTVRKTELSNQQGSGLAQELLRTVTISFTWKDLRSGRILAQRLDFEASDVYIASRPINEREEIAEWAVAEELARDIVSNMRDTW